MAVDKKYIISRQGKDFILYPGLLHEAHNQGLKRLTTTIIQLPTKENDGTAVVVAEAETEKGTFSGIGDANATNVNRMIIPHILRMAETRAKARALRDATDIDMVAFEEIVDEDDASSAPAPAQQAARPASNPQAAPKQERQEPVAPKTSDPPSGQIQYANGQQAAAIRSLQKQLGLPNDDDPSLTADQARAKIAALQKQLDDKKRGGR